MLKPLWPQFAQGNQSRLAQYRVNETLYTSHALGYSQTCTGKSCFQCSRLPQRTMSPVTCERMHGARDMNTLWCGIRRATIFGAKTRASIGINKFTSSARGCHAIGRAISATLTANLVPTQAASHGIEKTAPPRSRAPISLGKKATNWRRKHVCTSSAHLPTGPRHVDARECGPAMHPRTRGKQRLPKSAKSIS